MRWIALCFIVLSSTLLATLRADINGDCRVDLADLAILMSEWMESEDCNMSLGPEKLTNGGFDGSLDGWVVTGDFSYQGSPTEGEAVYDGLDGSGQGRLTQTLPAPIPAGTALRWAIDLSQYEGYSVFPDGENFVNFLDENGLTIQSGTQLYPDFGHYSGDIVLVADCYKIQVYIESGQVDNAAVADNFSIKEVLADGTGSGGYSDFFNEDANTQDWW